MVLRHLLLIPIELPFDDSTIFEQIQIQTNTNKNTITKCKIHMIRMRRNTIHNQSWHLVLIPIEQAFDDNTVCVQIQTQQKYKYKYNDRVQNTYDQNEIKYNS